MESSEQKPSIEERLAAHFAPQEPAAEKPQEAAEPTEEVEAAEEAPIEAEGEERAQEASDEAPEIDDDEDVINVSSLSDLMEHFEIAPEDVYNLTVPVTVNGKRQDVSLSEWKDSYVAAQEARRHQEEARALREQIDQQRQQAEEQYQAQLAQGAALVDSLEKQALAQFEGVNWAELRQTDPAEWAAQQTSLEKARAQIQQVKQEVRNKIQEFQSKQQEARNEQIQEHLRKEREALYNAWPEMGDESKAATERTALIEELKSRGFTDQEIGNAYDHRILLLARDAMRWRQSASKADAAKKKVVKVGKKVVKPGARQSRAEQRQDAIRPMRDRLRKSGDWRDAAALISKMRNE